MAIAIGGVIEWGWKFFQLFCVHTFFVTITLRLSTSRSTYRLQYCLDSFTGTKKILCFYDFNNYYFDIASHKIHINY